MDLKKPSRFAKIALFTLLFLVLGFVGLTLWASKRPLFDPDPKGEGSFDEAAAITKQFPEYYRTKNAELLPKGYIRLKGFDIEEDNDTWLIYYATASHSTVRGGTIVLLDSFGRIDTYFGHHCSSVDGGTVMISTPTLLGDFYEGAVEGVRSGFDELFKHQKTEQVGDGDAEEAF